MTTNETDTIVRDVLDRFVGAWAANDADAVAAVYTEDATLVMTGIFQNGREEIREFMRTAFDGQLTGSRATNKPRLIRRINDDTVVVISDIGIIMAGENAVPEDGRRVATWTITRVDGEWFITAYHNCPLK
ncbi:SnoaL-like domain protein [Actinomadura rubteroloni]|uniref:SnoaL-like domain protein n=1 Tax=Actinomadura rubteroloni TaxID=1926885 RepID=A0A2P4UCR3_9ACTN|nr:SgcJ/EcaC family oxidoreductase [Actinomadura rubteroloni]POM22838.1 SnoaL-like domain protein [Actinomadura rubteroloni]